MRKQTPNDQVGEFKQWKVNNYRLFKWNHYKKRWDEDMSPMWEDEEIYITKDENFQLKKDWYAGKTFECFMHGEWREAKAISFDEILFNMHASGLRYRPKSQDYDKWRESIPSEGIWCWVWNEFLEQKLIHKVSSFDGGVYFAVNGEPYSHAEPLTREEVAKYTLKR